MIIKTLGFSMASLSFRNGFFAIYNIYAGAKNAEKRRNKYFYSIAIYE